jgi:uncharacterized protein involved in response to NO
VKARGVALLDAGFRPFFLLGAGWSVVALGLWIAVLVGSAGLPSRFDPITWHIHEMLYGLVLAAVAGFLLTAIPNWTGRPPVDRGTLLSLAALWIAGRGACLASGLMPLWLPVILDLAFPVALGAVVARELIAARNRRNYLMMGPLCVLAVADLLMHLPNVGVDVPVGLGWRLAVACILVLISVIGGRILPAFTRNWLKARGDRHAPVQWERLDQVALPVLHVALLAWALAPNQSAVGVLLVIAAGLHAWRLSGWCGAATVQEPLLLVLHAGYLWLVTGVAMLGISVLASVVPAAAALHAVTAGAFGTMLLAMMTRVALGHTGRPLRADASTRVIYVLVTAAAVLRVAAGWPGDATMLLLEAAAAAWIAAFALYVVHYGPMLVSARRR